MQIKIIPGFARYKIQEDGVVTNALTGIVITQEDNFSRRRVKLIADDAKRVWFYIDDHLESIFPKPVAKPESNFTKELSSIPSGSSKRKYSERTLKKYDFSSMTPEQRRNIHASNKLSKEDIIEIRRLLSTREMTKKQVGEKYGIAQQTAGKIERRVIYKDV